MRGVTFPGEREVALVEFPDPVPGAGEVVIEMKASGMCGSDLHYYRRPKGTPMGARPGFHNGPVICGHEPCGIVVETGTGVMPSLARVGDRVMVYHYAGCGACGTCRSGWEQMCRDVPVHVYGGNDHGGHARYIKVPAMAALRLPDAISFEAGAAISCGTGTAYAALRRLRVSGEHTIAIFGQGPVGLAATQLGKAMGGRVIAIDISGARRALAQSFGADVVLDPVAGDIEAMIRDHTRGLGADCAIDTSGAAAARASAVRALKPWGSACMIGEGGTLTVDVSPDLLRKQATIFGSWTFSSVIQAECAQFVADRNINVDAIFSHRWGLEQAAEAYRLFDQQSTGKGVITF